MGDVIDIGKRYETGALEGLPELGDLRGDPGTMLVEPLARLATTPELVVVHLVANAVWLPGQNLDAGTLYLLFDNGACDLDGANGLRDLAVLQRSNGAVLVTDVPPLRRSAEADDEVDPLAPTQPKFEGQETARRARIDQPANANNWFRMGCGECGGDSLIGIDHLGVELAHEQRGWLRWALDRAECSGCGAIHGEGERQMTAGEIARSGRPRKTGAPDGLPPDASLSP